MSQPKTLKVIDFHVHVDLKEHWHDWVHDYQKSASSELYERYEELIDPDGFARYLESHSITRAVILPEISPLILVSFTAFFALGFAFYASLYAAVGAAVNTVQEAPDLSLSLAGLFVVFVSYEFVVVTGVSLATEILRAIPEKII